LTESITVLVRSSQMLLLTPMKHEFSTYLASKKVFWWCRGERGKSGTIFFDLVVFLKFSVCSTKQQQNSPVLYKSFRY